MPNGTSLASSNCGNSGIEFDDAIEAMNFEINTAPKSSRRNLAQLMQDEVNNKDLLDHYRKQILKTVPDLKS